MNNELESIVAVRPYKPEDKSFILATFLRGLYYDNEFFKMIPKNDFMDNYKQVGEALVKSGLIRVACLREDIEVIVGYSITSKNDDVLHWVYVKAGQDKELTWRKRGVSKLLIPESVSTFTHFTSLGLAIKNKFPRQLTFNPFKT